MLRKFFEAMWCGIMEMVCSLLEGLLDGFLLFVPGTLMSIGACRVVAKLHVENCEIHCCCAGLFLAFSLIIIIGGFLTGIWFRDFVYHCYRAAEFAMKKNCSIKRAWKRTWGEEL